MPPRGGDPFRSLKIAQLLKDKIHAVNITDGSRAVMRMCSMAMSKLRLENGIEPVMQISCRYSNKIDLQSDILGANALGIRNILCITGDSVKAGDQQDAKAVHEFESVRLLQQIQTFNKGIDPTLGELADQKTFIFSGAAADPSCRNQRSLENKSKVITAELMPPRGGDPVRSLKIAQLLKDKVHAVNITDGSRAVMRMCSLAMSKLLLENGIEPVMQISCRDRNKIALQSDILGANALGIKNILCITGDSVKAGDQQDLSLIHI